MERHIHVRDPWKTTISGIRKELHIVGTEESGLLEAIPFNHCGIGPAVNLSIQTFSSAPDQTAIRGDSVICSGLASSLRVDSLPGTVFHWLLPDHWTGGSSTHELSFISSSAGGEVMVSASNACSRGDTLIKMLRIENVPEEALIIAEIDYWCQTTGRFWETVTPIQ